MILQSVRKQAKYKLKLYYGVCKSGEEYIDKTKRNIISRWSEHAIATKDSETARHLSQYINHVFTWKTLCHASKNTDIRKNLEAVIIALLKSSLYEQKNFERLILFRNAVA